MLLTSCQEHNNSIHLSEVPSVAISGSSLGNLELQSPRKIFTINNEIVLFDETMKDGFLCFIDSGNGEIIRYYGIEGRASNEYLEPNVFPNNYSVLIQTIDGNTYSVDTTCRPRKVLPGIEPSTRIGSNFVGLCADSTIIVSSPSTDNRLDIINYNGTSAFNLYPFKTENGLQLLKETVFDASYCISYDGNKVIIADRYYPLVEIVDIETKTSTVCRIEENGCKNVYVVDNGYANFEDPYLKYSVCKTGRNGFFALYHNLKMDDAIQVPPEIHYFSYDGKLEKRYILDRVIYDFALFDDETGIYALGLNDSFVAEIFKFALP